ncbi:MAG: hypothetical protein SOX11_10275, partial [Lachnospiraceae bacterium]|nr:hypothetical protein [Lachnospiraceae bacterium]
FNLSSMTTQFDIVLFYSFTEPISTPLTKYFCRKGYTIRIGTVVTIIVSYYYLSFPSINH